MYRVEEQKHLAFCVLKYQIGEVGRQGRGGKERRIQEKRRREGRGAYVGKETGTALGLEAESLYNQLWNVEMELSFYCSSEAPP